MGIKHQTLGFLTLLNFTVNASEPLHFTDVCRQALLNKEWAKEFQSKEHDGMDIELWTYDVEQTNALAKDYVSQIIVNLIVDALASEQYSRMNQLIQNHGSSLHFEELTTMTIIQKAIAADQSRVIKTLESVLDSHYLEQHPFVAILLSLSHENLIDEEVFVNFEPFDNREKLILASIFHAKDYPHLSRKALAEIERLSEMNDEQISAVAQLWEQYKLVNHGLKLIERERNVYNVPALEKAWLLLATSSGKSKEVLEMLTNFQDYSEQELQKLFFIAADEHHKLFALTLAQVLYERYPNSKNRKYLAEAYLLNGNSLSAYELVQKLEEKNIDTANLKIAILAEASAQSSDYHIPLREIVLDKISNYPTAIDEQRKYAYLLLKHGYREEAAILLRDISSGLPYESQDVQALLTIWGDTPSSTSIQWIQSRIAKSDEQKKALWFEQLKRLGKIADSLGQYELAEQVYYQIYQRSPEDPRAIKDLWFVKAKLGKRSHAAYLAYLYSYYDPSLKNLSDLEKTQFKKDLVKAKARLISQR